MNLDTTFLQTVSGRLEYTLTNDYMFRALMQSSNNTLRRLLAALLPVPYEEIRSCEILNPIILGDAIDQKTCVMDVRVRMNNDRLINLEVQMYPYAAWPKRALFYLCRLYCNIRRGQDYGEIMSAVHIGILKESPFPDVDRFYSKYELTDVENTGNIHIFTGDFSLRVLNLGQIDNVPEEERSSERYLWARLLRATTWEEIKMLAEKNEAIQEAAAHLHILTEDEKIRLQCEAREMYEHDITTIRNEGRRQGREEGIKEGIKEGRKEGIEQGIEQGIELNLIRQVSKKLGKACTVAQIADALEESEERISRIAKIAKKYAPEYDERKILSEIMQEHF